MSDSIDLKLSIALGNVASSLKKVTSLLNITGNTGTKRFASVAQRTKAINQSVINLNKDLTRTNKLFGAIGTGVSSLGAIAGIGSLYALVDTLSNAINSAVAAVETQNLFTVALGESADEADAFVTKLSEATGLDYSNLQNTVATYALLAKSMNFTSDQAETLATSTTALALDLSSLTNVPVAQVMSDLKSGLLGQSETVYKYGLDVTEAGIKQEALAQGITKSVRNMSQGEKMALRYDVYVRTLTKDLGNGTSVVGDFARTIGQPANQLKILSNQFITLGRAIGNIFLPLLAKVLPYVNAIVSILIDAANALAKLFGYTKQVNKSGLSSASIVEDAEDATDAINGTTSAAKKLNKTILGIDELNLMAAQPDSASTSGGTDTADTGSILDNIDLTAIEDMFDGISGVDEELKEKLLPTLKRVAIAVGVVGGAFLLWKLSSAFLTTMTNLPKTLTAIQNSVRLTGLTFQIFAGFALIIGGCTLAFIGLNGILKKNTTSWKNLALAVGGVLLAIGGVAIISTSLAPYAALIGGITLAFVGFKTAIQSATPTLQTFLLTLSGIAIAAVALAFIFSPIVGVIVGIIAALALVGVYIYKYRDQIGDFFVKIGTAIADFVTWLSNLWLEKLKKGLELIGGFFSDIGTAIYNFVTKTVPDFINKFGEFMLDLPNKIAYALGFVIGTLARWAVDFVTWVIDNVPILVDSIKDFFVELPDKIYNAIIYTKDKIVSWVTNVVSTIKTEVPKIISNIVDFFSGLPSKIYNAIITTKDKIVTWAVNMKNTIATEVPKIISGIVDFFAELPTKIYDKMVGLASKFKDIGTYILKGIMKGLSNVGDEIASWGDSFVKGFEDAFDINSPSKVFEDKIGTYLGQGILVGLEGTFDSIVGCATDIAGGVQTAFDSVSGVNLNNLSQSDLSVDLGTATIAKKYTSELTSVGTANDISTSTIAGITDVMSNSENKNGENSTLNLYIEGVYSGTISDYQRKNLRSGKVVIPIT